MLHPLLAGRFSPTVFDTDHVVDAAGIDSLIEAARWAPSAGNSQPWAFLVGRRGDDTHRRLVSRLAPSSARWAPTAALLIVNLCHRFVADTDWEYSEFSAYDLGQAVAHMTVQAHALGLHVRQFRAFDRDGLTADLAIPPHWQAETMSAIGRAATGPDDRPPPRQRREANTIRWTPPRDISPGTSPTT